MTVCSNVYYVKSGVPLKSKNHLAHIQGLVQVPTIKVETQFFHQVKALVSSRAL